MTTVRVFGRIMYPQSNLPYAGAHVVFMLDRGSWTADNRNYPTNPCIAYTDSNGDFAIDLWANREGSIPTKWICTLPDGDRFEFILLASMNQIALSQLRQSNQSWGNTPSPSGLEITAEGSSLFLSLSGVPGSIRLLTFGQGFTFNPSTRELLLTQSSSPTPSPNPAPSPTPSPAPNPSSSPAPTPVPVPTGFSNVISRSSVPNKDAANGIRLSGDAGNRIAYNALTSGSLLPSFMQFSIPVMRSRQSAIISYLSRYENATVAYYQAANQTWYCGNLTKFVDGAEITLSEIPSSAPTFDTTIVATGSSSGDAAQGIRFNAGAGDRLSFNRITTGGALPASMTINRQASENEPTGAISYTQNYEGLPLRFWVASKNTWYNATFANEQTINLV